MRYLSKHIAWVCLFVAVSSINLKAATFEKGKTYVITQDIVLTASETIASDVTLIFQGGKITSKSAVTLTGNHTKIVAPLGRIFDDNISITGSWDIDRAYPQWFGAVTYDSFQNYNTATSVNDAGKAINKAITMKQRGEVFLTKGIYIIATPIILTDGIQLVGERGMEPQTNGNFYEGTILQSWKDKSSTITDNNDKFMIYVNANSNKQRITKGDFLSGQITAIQNVELYNFIPSGTINSVTQLQNSTTACMKGIFAYESCQLDHVRFYNFRQALLYSGDKYIDNKQVTNCDYVCNNGNFKNLDRLYAYDFKWFGDNLHFEHNTIQDRRYNKGINIMNSNGGVISCNIINADVNFDRCKGFVFSNNHMEYGPTITINSSNITTYNNYIERGHETPFVVTGQGNRNKCILTMHGDMIIFIDRPRNLLEGDEGEYNVNYNTFRSRLNNASDYDIVINKDAIISLEQVYRYRICDISEKLSPMGIKICKADTQEPFDEFNDFSYMLSQKGNISSDFIVNKDFTLSNINSLEVYTAMKNNETYWLAPSGVYTYQYQIIYDKKRQLLATRNNNQLFNVKNSNDMSQALTQNTKNGVLLVVADNNGNGARGVIRLIRRRNGTSGFSYVDIPNNNNHLLHDNGISINGYHWQQGNSSDILKGATNIESITYQGNNVVCRVSGSTDNSKWQKGDVIINTGNNANSAVQVVK